MILTTISLPTSVTSEDILWGNPRISPSLEVKKGVTLSASASKVTVAPPISRADPSQEKIDLQDGSLKSNMSSAITAKIAAANVLIFEILAIFSLAPASPEIGELFGSISSDPFGFTKILLFVITISSGNVLSNALHPRNVLFPISYRGNKKSLATHQAKNNRELHLAIQQDYFASLFNRGNL